VRLSCSLIVASWNLSKLFGLAALLVAGRAECDLRFEHLRVPLEGQGDGGMSASAALASSITASVTVEISVGETSAPYISSKCAWIARTVIPRPYRDRILLSNPVHLVWCLGTTCGSKLPSRSRGISMGSSPNSPLRVFLLLPFGCCPWGWRRARYCLAQGAQPSRLQGHARPIF
jgi:hypothetical protein